MRLQQFQHGIAINADCLDQSVPGIIAAHNLTPKLLLCDPPYGRILKEQWDNLSAVQLSNMLVETLNRFGPMMPQGSAAYVFGGIGTPLNRPFFTFLVRAEEETPFRLSNLCTWAKKRGYGTQANFLFTREELAFFIKGNPKKPLVFNVPYLDKERPYAGWNKKHPARSNLYRRTNVWSDISDMGKKSHPAEKPIALLNIPIRTSSNEGDVVFDPFGGLGSTAVAAIRNNRRFIIIERDERTFDVAVNRITHEEKHV